jgi:alpha-beta hydrolase superfamily lysophospholipase
MQDGTQLYIRDWYAEDHIENHGPKPCVVMLHGLCEHSGRYDHIAAFFNARGFAVRTYDHRGHGKSGGMRGDSPGETSIVNDAEIIIGDFAKQCQTSPILFGHSMGGLFAARIATEKKVPLRGLILSSPALALWLTPLLRILLKLLSAIAPHVAIKVRFKPEFLSHNLATVVSYLSDPLIHQQFTASLVNSMLSSIDFAQTHASTLTIPTLLLVAEADEIVDPQGSHDFFAALPGKIATAHFYIDDYHEIFNELDTDKVFSDLHNWLVAQQLVPLIPLVTQ